MDSTTVIEVSKLPDGWELPDGGRELRGRQLAAIATIKKVGRRYAVPSQTASASGYLVDIEESACTCPDYELRKGTCKHQHAVLFWIAWGRDVDADGTVTETVTVKRKTYAQKDWSAYNESQTHEKEYVERLLTSLCDGLKDPPRKPGAGRNRRPLRDRVFEAVMKVYNGGSGRWAQTDLRESAAKGHVGSVGHFNSVFNFLADEDSTALLVELIEESAAPLAAIENGQYAIDSTGFSTVTYDRWFDQKHGTLHAQHPWIKLHVMVGTVTHAITGVKVSPAADGPQLPALAVQTMKHHLVKEVSADKAYSSFKNHEVLYAFGIEAFIPFKINAAINKKSRAWSEHLTKFHFEQDKFLPHYHRRSNVETTIGMLKQKFGAKVASKRPIAQMNEVLAKCLCHNLACLVKAIFVSGLAPQFWADATPTALTLVQP